MKMMSLIESGSASSKPLIHFQIGFYRAGLFMRLLLQFFLHFVANKCIGVVLMMNISRKKDFVTEITAKVKI